MLLLKDIHIRDPFILTEDRKYYLYGSRGDECFGQCTGFDVYVSDDLTRWTEPVEAFHTPEGFWSDRQYWAPEVHKFGGRFYMFASFKSETRRRGVQILVADAPVGPFRVHSDGPLTPDDWECLDGTLYVARDGTPYMVFCHEWVQVRDGEMCAMRLSDDLSRAVEPPFLLFHASEPGWAQRERATFVTDGPFLFRTSGGQLLMIWSSLAESGYVEAVSVSDNGEITGAWHHQGLLFDRDGGHGMIFRDNDGKCRLVLHVPNRSPDERPQIIELCEKDDFLYLK